MTDGTKRIRIWPIGSGKGGVGKTLLTANLGILLARMGWKVTLLDCDLGASNLHTHLGIPYLKKSLNDLLIGRFKTLEQTEVKTSIPGLRLIGGSRHLPSCPNYRTRLTRKILTEIPSLDTEILLMDLGGGINPDVLDLFLLSDQGIVVTTNDPSSIQNTYQFLKMAVFRRILKAFPNNPLMDYLIHSATQSRSREAVHSLPELLDRISHVDRYYAERIQTLLHGFIPRMIMNMVNQADDLRASEIVTTVSRKFTGISPEFLGTLEYSPTIRESIQALCPFILDPQNRKVTEQLNLIAHRLLDPPTVQNTIRRKTGTGSPATLSQEKQEIWFKDQIRYHDQPLSVLTEKLQHHNQVQTSIYCKGKILFSRKVDYPELKENTDDKTLQRIVRKQHLCAMKGIETGRLSVPDR